MDLVGYHGTDNRVFGSIKSNNFNSSRGEDHWLGEGAYFFIDGVSECPKKDAENWAHIESYDAKTKGKKYTHLCVIEAKITLKSALDLRDREVLKLFNEMRIEYMSRVKDRIKGKIFDNDCISSFAKQLDLDGVIADLFFKFKKIDKIMRTNSRIPNCTVLCVRNPAGAISLDPITKYTECAADHER